MKRLLILLCIMSLVLINLSAIETNTITSDNYTTETLKNVFIQMPDYREIKSGSKFIVTYEGDWPAEMQGAFEYAVKIWEEVLPMTLPINISAKIGSIRGADNILSRVTFETLDYNGQHTSNKASPSSMIKGVLLQEYHTGFQTQFYDEIEDVSIFNDADMTIAYNSNMIDQFDFSLDGNPDLDKYDFVTVAMRDIAIGLGFTSTFTADISQSKLNITGKRLFPFEGHIMDGLKSDDPYVAFQNATKGSVEIDIGYSNGSMLIYAPQTWVNGKSLRFSIPDDNPISKLLTHDFGKGYVMHDLSGINWQELFEHVLDWVALIPSGGQVGSAKSMGTSEDILPYKGQVALSFNDTNNVIDGVGTLDDANLDRYKIVDTTSAPSRAIFEDMPTSLYCKKFNSSTPSGPTPGISLSVLKKDGTWDCLYTNSIYNLPIILNIEDLELHFDESEYARGTSGGLRYRLTKCTYYEDRFYGPYHVYKTKYFTRDYIPQKAYIKYDRNTGTVKDMQVRGIPAEDWFIDVNIGLANLEGTTRVVVEQLEEGNDLPFQYEVEDFRKGYFTANLDRECDTQLTVICYNDNGFSRSNTIQIPAIGYSSPYPPSLSVLNQGTYIQIYGLNNKLLAELRMSYSIQNIVTGLIIQSAPITSHQIDISNLPKGVYSITLYKDSVQYGRTQKFIKK